MNLPVYRLIFVCVSSVLILNGASADDASIPATVTEPTNANTEYRAVMRELLQVTDALNLGKQVADGVFQSMLASQQVSGKPMPPRVQEIMREAASDFFDQILGSEEEMVRDQATIYAKHFTQSELEDLLAFYRTPLGSKMMSTLPSIMADAMALGQSKAMQKMPLFQAELRRRFESEGISLR